MPGLDDFLAANVSVALVHYPVVDKNGMDIASAVTSLDLHDIARSARTYGVDSFRIITPLVDQQDLIKQIIDHWITGVGSAYNPDRKDALALIKVHFTLAEAVKALTQIIGTPPRTVVTSARMANSNLSHAGLRDLVKISTPLLLIFGTAWGLAQSIIDEADYRLEPIQGNGSYNHLAVRSAVAVILDRLFSGRK
jgi:hypothetical protein